MVILKIMVKGETIMEQEKMLKEILKALKLHSDRMDEKFKLVDDRFDRIEGRLDRLEKQMDGFRVELTKETVDFIS
jgi:predicted nuclease with TOPRIM domain